MDIENGKWKSEGYWFSHYNYEPEIRKGWCLPEQVKLHDATLRDGEQTPGVVLLPDEKIRIAEKLAEVGVDRIEAGMPAVSADDFNAIKSITSRGLKSQVFAFARANVADVQKVADSGANGVVIETPIGYPKLRYQFKKDWRWVLESSAEAIQEAKRCGLYVVYFPYDTTRCLLDEFDALLSGLCKDAKPDSVGVIDTVGCAIPEAVGYLTRHVKKLTGCAVEVHTHNDLGMGVATSIAAVENGAEVVHCCVNGMGERTGNTGLEELSLTLKGCLGYEMKGFRFDKLLELSELVTACTGVSVAYNRPVIGERSFARESGIGIDQVLNFPLSMFNMDPAFVGAKPKIMFGKKSGLASVQVMLERMGLEDIDREVQKVMLGEIKATGIEKKRSLSDDEVQEIIRKHI